MSKYLDEALHSLRTPLIEGRGVKVFKLDEKAPVDKAQEFADIAFNKKGWFDKLMLKDRGLSREAAEKKLLSAGFKVEEILKLRSWLKKATENVAGDEKIMMVRMPDNFSGWGFTVGRGKDADEAGLREIGSLADEKAFNNKVHKEFLRLAKQHKLTEAAQGKVSGMDFGREVRQALLRSKLLAAKKPFDPKEEDKQPETVLSPKDARQAYLKVSGVQSQKIRNINVQLENVVVTDIAKATKLLNRKFGHVKSIKNSHKWETGPMYGTGRKQATVRIQFDKAVLDDIEYVTEENKYQVACQKTGKRYTFNTSKNYNVGDIVTMDGRRRKVVKVLKEGTPDGRPVKSSKGADHNPEFDDVLDTLPDVTRYVSKWGPHYYVDKKCGCKDGDDVKFALQDRSGNPQLYFGTVVRNEDEDDHDQVKQYDLDFELINIEEA